MAHQFLIIHVATLLRCTIHYVASREPRTIATAVGGTKVLHRIVVLENERLVRDTKQPGLEGKRALPRQIETCYLPYSRSQVAMCCKLC